MKTSFTLNDIENIQKTKEVFKKDVEIQIVDNQVISTRQPERLSIVDANNILARSRISPRNTDSPSTIAAAKAFLNSINCTIIKKKEDFSFLHTRGAFVGTELKHRPDESDPDYVDLSPYQNDPDYVDLSPYQNPNIADPYLEKLQNSQTTAESAFPNDNDAIYEFDDAPPEKDKLLKQKMLKKQKRKTIIRLASDLAQANLRKNQPALKYFT
jgi:hypothetical protein